MKPPIEDTSDEKDKLCYGKGERKLHILIAILAYLMLGLLSFLPG